MRIIRTTAVAVLLAIVSAPAISAKDWFVCLSSFRERSNAEQFKEELAAKSVPSFVSKAESAGQTIYRVLLTEPFPTKDDAQRLSNGIEKALRNHVAISGGLWVCLADPPNHTEPEKRTIRVTDSDTGRPVALARLTVDETMRTDTDNDGKAELPDGLSDGRHSLLIESDGHIATRTHFSTEGGAVQTPPSYSVARVVEGEGGSIKVVLNWGLLPEDLDLHVFSGSRHVYFSNMHSSGADSIDLDRDDTYYEGPETITVRNRNSESVYRFYVHNYSNKDNPTSSVMSRSGARVQLTMDNVDIGTYSVPADSSGVWWHIFDIEGDEIILYDTVSAVRE